MPHCRDLVRAVADDHERGIAKISLDIELGRVAVSSVDSDGVQAASEANSLAIPAPTYQRICIDLPYRCPAIFSRV